LTISECRVAGVSRIHPPHYQALHNRRQILSGIFAISVDRASRAKNSMIVNRSHRGAARDLHLAS
jgi:hypothetical protein